MLRFASLALIPLVLLSPLACNRAEKQPKEPLSADALEVIKGNNEFAFDLYQQFAKKEEGNFVFSPFSISTALAMTYAGARGETAEQMKKTLHYPLEQERFHPAMGSVIQRVQKFNGSDLQMYVANALWGQKGFGFLSSFMDLMRAEHQAGFKEADFIGNPETARRTINARAAGQTRKKINELLKTEDVRQNVRLILTNAIYFKGLWEVPFTRENTKEALFEVAPDETIKVQMMHKQGWKEFGYFADNDFQYLQLPYKGDTLAMVLILPVKKGMLKDLESTLTINVVTRSLSKMRLDWEGVVALPRFTVRTHVIMNRELIQLGMPLAFNDGADFTGMTGSRELHIESVIHEAVIDINEAGTEAAAATAVTMSVSTRPTFTFRADHPFLYAVINPRTKEILFLGRLCRPNASETSPSGKN